MTSHTATPMFRSRRQAALRVGFLPLTDCAPLIMARELGFFAQHDLDVQLCRERDWGVLRDKLVGGELDAMQAPATFPLTLPLGIGCEPCACIAGMVLNLQGNAITLSAELATRGVSDAASLRREIQLLAGRRTLSFGVPHSHSTHGLLLRHWLRLGGIDPATQVRIIPVPPMEMFPHLKLGYLDGYCVGEPWNSVAVECGAGFCVASSAELAPLHPEKVLLVRRDFAVHRAEEHVRLLAALIESCRFCDVPRNWSLIRNVLTQLQYVNAPVECLLSDTGVPFNLDRPAVPDFHQFVVFHRHRANAPTRERALWLLDQMVLHGLLPAQESRHREILLATFSNETFGRALALAAAESRAVEGEARRLAAL